MWKEGKKTMTEKLNSIENVKKAMELSDRFSDLISNWAYEEAMQQQEDYSRWNKADGLRFHNLYSSFFYTIYDRDSFIRSTEDFDDPMYEDLSKEANKLLDRLNAMEYDNKQYDNLDSKLDSLAKELLNMYEGILHAFEFDWYKEDYINDSIEMWLDYGKFENYYIEENQVKHFIPARIETL